MNSKRGSIKVIKSFTEERMKHEEWNRRKRNARETVVELGV